MVAATAAWDRPAFSAWVAEEDGGRVLRLAGEFDFTVLGLLDRALSGVQPEPGRAFPVDASHLSFMDASGVRRLVAADARLRAGGGAGLTVRCASAPVRRILDVMGGPELLADGGGAPGGPPPAVELDLARQAAGMSVTELFVAYFALGGTAELAGVSAFLAGYPAALDVHQRQLVVQAVNERLTELGRTDGLRSVSPD